MSLVRRIHSLGGRLILTFLVFLALANVFVFLLFERRGLFTQAENAKDPLTFLADTMRDPGILSAILLLQATAGVITVVFMILVVERRPLLPAAVHPKAGAAAVGWGLILGFILSSVVALFIAAASGRHLRPELFAGAAAGQAVFLAVVIAAAAFMEELLFRGYLFRIIREQLGGGRTIFLTALAFSAVHVTNPGATLLAWFNILLMGVVLGQLRAVSGGMAMPFGLHLGWNLALGMLFGVPVSGLQLPSAFRISLDDVSPALGGGGFGPEASVVLTVLLVVVVGLLVRRFLPPGGAGQP